VAKDMHRSDPMTFSPLLEKLRRAARQHRQVKMLYQGSASPEATERQVDPYALVHRSGWWYLVAYCHLRQALRTFRVDRIQNLELLAQPFQKPDDFDVHAYLEDAFGDQPVVRARLRFVPQAAHIALTNLAGWESCQENPDGSVDVELSAPDLPWLASITLSFANMVTVLDPPELRQMVVEWAQSVVAVYQNS
jgi:predicted DNA-binding transcriptional regulator YafY